MVAAILANEEAFTRRGVHTFPPPGIAGHNLEVQLDFAGLTPSTKTIHRATNTFGCRREQPSGSDFTWHPRVCKLHDRLAGAVINEAPACAGITATENPIPNNIGIHSTGLGSVRGQCHNAAVGENRENGKNRALSPVTDS